MRVSERLAYVKRSEAGTPLRAAQGISAEPILRNTTSLPFATRREVSSEWASGSVEVNLKLDEIPQDGRVTPPHAPT